ncbi:unnamed protein product [Paramecium sonneborni]|uniref:Uncharacterized protein n=1 Tax=Paramecium sonneborni TaxID=65129 RepID=A0A8S1KH25_9CILI|nr:unnamed protein product [Paramecium sonneborni]
MSEFNIRQLLYQEKYQQDSQYYLKFKAYILDVQKNCKKQEFTAWIEIKEIVNERQRLILFTKDWLRSFPASKIKNKKKQGKEIIVIWEIPINHMFFPCPQTKIVEGQILFYNLKKLTLTYKRNDDQENVQKKEYKILFEKFYLEKPFNQSNKDVMNDELKEYALYQQILVGGQIQIKILGKNTLFKENESIEIKLEGNFSQIIPSEFKAHLCEKIIFEGKVLSERRLCELQKKEQKNEDNTLVTFTSSINQVANQMRLLYLGSQIQCHHIIKINIQLKKKFFFDCCNRIFNIIIPIEVIDQNQEIRIVQENENNFGIYNLVQNNEIKAKLCPQLCDNYKSYMKTKIIQIR